MTRTIASLALGALFLVGCSDPELEKRIADLEAKVGELEKRPAAPAGAQPANAEQEQAAAELFKAANSAMEEGNYEQAKAKLNELNEKYGTTRAARAAQRLAQELEVIGKDAGDLQVEKWLQGNASMTDGEATLLVFWEVWCPHCKREVPKLAETYSKYNPKGLNVIGLTKMTRDVTEEQVNEFIQTQKVPYPIAKEQGDAMSQYYGVRGIPAAAVVKDGKVVWRGHPARLNDEMIEGWIGS